MFSLDAATWRAARRALDKAVALYLNDPNVSHVDLGRRIRSCGGAGLEPELTVRVHVHRKLCGHEFEAFAAQHPGRVVTAEHIGFDVEVLQATYLLDRRQDRAATDCEHNRFYPELRRGLELSNAAGQNIGTSGGPVRDRHTGEDMLLGTWHVLAGSWNLSPGCAIYQTKPGGKSGGEGNIIARLSRHAMEDHLDAALARLEAAQPLLNAWSGAEAVTGVAIPQIGMKVIKYGGGKSAAIGIITGVLGYGVHHYDGVPRVIGCVVHIASTEPEKPISVPGDSGSWWLECSTHRAVALHFASSSAQPFALALSMPEVLTALKAEIVPHEKSVSSAGFVSNPKAPKSTFLSPGNVSRASLQERQSKILSKYAHACLLAMLFAAAIRSAFLISECQRRHIVQVEQLQRRMQQLQTIDLLDGARRQSIRKITAIIDRLKPNMIGSVKLEIADEIYAMSRKYANLDVELICATITHETGWSPEAVSSAGALGLMQILPSTGIHLAREEGMAWSSADKILFNPIWNIRLGCRYLAGLVGTYTLDAGLAAYNGGEKQAQRWLRSGRADGILPTETAAYVPSVLRIYEQYQRLRDGNADPWPARSKEFNPAPSRLGAIPAWLIPESSASPPD
ncbi:MAG: transglycosylase SLT domain-containing protein [bacterium]